jgi:hypothetical protein
MTASNDTMALPKVVIPRMVWQRMPTVTIKGSYFVPEILCTCILGYNPFIVRRRIIYQALRQLLKESFIVVPTVSAGMMLIGDCFSA